MMQRANPFPSHNRRGSVFILVVAVLSVLALLTLTLSYVSRMDLLASRNWGNTVQSRMAAVTGIPAFSSGTQSGIYGTSGSSNASGLNASAARATPSGGNDGANGESRPSSMPVVRMHSRMRSAGGSTPADGGLGRRREAASGQESLSEMTSSTMESGDTLQPLKLEMELDAGRLLGLEISPITQLRGVLATQSQGTVSGTSVASRTSTASVLAGSRRSGRLGSRISGSRPSASSSRDTTTLDDTALTTETSAELATALLEDTAAKININAVEPAPSTASSRQGMTLSGQTGQVQEAAGTVTEATLARLIAKVATANGIAGVDATTLAHQIALRRYGADGRPGTGYADDNANNGMSNPLSDGIDNDRDGLIDEADEIQVATAHDGLDNNHNGLIDEAGESIAQDGLDNNHNGRVDEANEAIDDPEEASSDPRKPAWGDDRLYGNLEELMGLPGMTQSLYKALSPYLTTFSVSFAAFDLGEDEDSGNFSGASSNAARRLSRTSTATSLDGTASLDEAALGFPQVDPNTVSPELLYQVLSQRFPDADEAVLGQFIANLIDRRDLDNIPTTIKIGDRSYTGMEITPCLNEVCPNPSAGENKDGQFVEIFNPWSQTFNLTGWSLRGSGVQTALNVSLPAGGYLVLTNDINNESDSSPEDEGAEGSFYNVYRKVGTGGQHQLVEVRGMSLASDGVLQLVNPDGMVVDVFEYHGGQNSGSARSFQRLDPRLRYAEQSAATPLEANTGVQTNADAAQALRIMELWQNQPLRSPLDAMLVSTAYAGSNGQEQGQGQGRGHHRPADGVAGAGQDQSQGQPPADGQAGGKKAHPFALPLLSDSTNENLDVRLVDCFRTGVALPAVQSTRDQSDQVGTINGLDGPGGTAALAATNASLLTASGELSRSTQPVAPRCAAVFGRINLNTAPLVVLAALPGMDETMVQAIATSREMMAQSAEYASGSSLYGTSTLRATNTATPGSMADWAWWVPESPFATPRWRNLSDYLRDETLWSGRPLYDRLDAVYPYCQMVTLHTMAVRLATANLPSLDTDEKAATAVGNTAARRPTLTRAERIVAGDRGAAETVDFKYAATYADKQVDPDARVAAPAASAKAFDLAALLNQVLASGGVVGENAMKAPVGVERASESATSVGNTSVNGTRLNGTSSASGIRSFSSSPSGTRTFRPQSSGGRSISRGR